MLEQKNCKLCNLPANIYGINPNGDSLGIDCERCGKYQITNNAYKDPSDLLNEKSYLLSGLSRQITEENGEKIYIFTNNIDKFLSDPKIPNEDDIDAKIVKLLRWIKSRSKQFGDRINLDNAKDYTIAYCKNPQELNSLINLANVQNLVDYRNSESTIGLSYEGWKEISILNKDRADSKNGFIAIWIDTSMKDSVDAISKAIKACDYTPIYISEQQYSDKIVDKALKEIQNSKFMIADMTGMRPSVFYEIGYAHALGIDVILVFDEIRHKTAKEKAKEEEKDIDKPFDFYAGHYKCVPYYSAKNLESIIIDAIQARIK